MTDDRLIMAIGRLERALTRVEALAGPGRSPDATIRRELANLVQRHERLRARTKDAIDAIDRLTDGV
ncbi:MAG: hypothetical protein ABS87_12460 [Sphingomonas sp. SCN 67-18]|uniref:hypothetical protein n=1 Tax=uncultured Sphingomonas sp. TaxID=158754 RepID=UPI00086C446E|nr:hypothetical protein [uncultured Sphingomonas sp.]ODU19955.1 MAG: hypothetical protein ABS87_12460 [Sphingomonas sp. SCN 67-18]